MRRWTTSNANGFAQARHGGFRTVAFQRKYAVSVDAAASRAALYGNVPEEAGVSGSAITGTADVPAGATVKLVNVTSDQTSDLPSGPFTIDTRRTTLRGGSGHERGERPVPGNTVLGKATVGGGGEAQKRRVTVDLSHAALPLASARVDPPRDKNGFDLSDGRFTDDGQRYAVTVKTVKTLEAKPSGAHLVLTFPDPERR
jgi:hypothetical protein